MVSDTLKDFLIMSKSYFTLLLKSSKWTFPKTDDCRTHNLRVVFSILDEKCYLSLCEHDPEHSDLRVIFLSTRWRNGLFSLCELSRTFWSVFEALHHSNDYLDWEKASYISDNRYVLITTMLLFVGMSQATLLVVTFPCHLEIWKSFQACE